jgi:hypothetical protein
MKNKYLLIAISVIIMIFGMTFTTATAINKSYIGLTISGSMVIIGVLLFAHIMDKFEE